MSLRILFADDSVTAQNMGKKILTEAGYEVVAVSNGAAAVKKIAEQKPDIIILDVYMPGYSGLEVCEKVRSSMATIKTPVLLTVGKMEPYKPEDANRVRADGVIIKPFEASDLLAIVKKFEERIEQMPSPVSAPPAPVRPAVEEITVQQPEANHEPPPRVMQSMVEVPDHMATSSAFSELLGTDATRMESFHLPAVAEAPAPPKAEEPVTAAESVDSDVPVSWSQEPEPRTTVVEAPVHSVAAIPSAAPVMAATSSRPIQIPVYQEPEPSHFEIVPTAAAPTGDIDIPREEGLQESAEETTRNTVADARDPDLVPTAHHIPAPQQTAVAELPVPQEMSADETQALNISEETLAPAEEVPAPQLSEADFEARVAAAMAAYGHAVEHREPAAVVHEEAPIVAAEPESSMEAGEPRAVATSVAEPPAEVVPEVEDHADPQPEIMAQAEPAITSAPVPEPVDESPVEPHPTTVNAAAAGVDHGAIMASVEAELPSAAQAVAQEAGESGAAHETIAQAVHRVMERMKENLVEEIVRELKSKK